MAAGMLQELDAAISQRLPGGLSLQVSDYFMDLDPLDDSFLLGEGLVSEGILLDEDNGLLGLGLTAAEAAFQHDYQMLNSKTASLQQQRGLLRATPETHTISGARQLPAPVLRHMPIKVFCAAYWCESSLDLQGGHLLSCLQRDPGVGQQQSG